MHSDIESAYLKWRATVKEAKSLRNDWERVLEQIERSREMKPRKYAGAGRYKRTAAHKEATRRGALKRWATPSERARNAVKSFWQTLTPEQRSERQRKAAKKMWKRRKAEAR